MAILAVGRPGAEVSLAKGPEAPDFAGVSWKATNADGYYCCFELPAGREIPVWVLIRETEEYEPYAHPFVIPPTGNHDLICGEFSDPAPHQHVLPPSVRKFRPRRGLVGADGGSFVDGQGRYHALGTTLFWAGWGYRHDRARLEQNLAYIAKAGIDYIRVLGEVGPGSGWEDRQVDPGWPDYDQVVAGLTDLAYDKYGLRVEWSIFGGIGHSQTAASREQLVRRMAAMARARPHKVQHFEIANEGWQTGFDGEAGIAEMRALGSIARGSGHLVALTAPTTPDYAKALYGGSAANLLTMHFDRSWNGTGREWRPVRQAWEVQFLEKTPRCWTSNEPIGPNSSVTADDDPLRIAMSAAITWLCGGAGYVLHTGAGIRGRDDYHPVGGQRPPNFWQTNNIEQILSGLRTVRTLIPVGIQNWSRHNSNDRFPQYPFDTSLLVAAIDREDLLRAYAATDGAEFVVAPIRVRAQVEFRARSSMHVEMFEPLTGRLLNTWDLKTGQSLTVGAENVAVILRGSFTHDVPGGGGARA